MATKWQKNKVDENSINDGYEYERKDRFSRESLNAIVNNSLYAANIAESVESQLSNLSTDEKIEFKGSNPNLLINSNFIVNQRGQELYIADGTRWMITADGWRSYNANNTFNVTTKTIAIKGTTTFEQLIEKINGLKGKTVTLSAKIKSVASGSQYRLFIVEGGVGQTNGEVISSTAVVTLTKTLASSLTSLRVGVINSSSDTTTFPEISVDYFKLEIGSIATAYSPKAYEEELADCQVINGGIAATYSNPNLLINGDFRVNQRGQASYSNYVYGVDRWIGNDGSVVEPQTNGGLKITRTTAGNGVLQRVEDWSNLVGKTVTFSAKITNITGSMRITIFTGVSSFRSNIISTDGIVSVTTELPTDMDRLECFINPIDASEVIVEYAKLELGSVATAYSPRPYAEELALCQRYYQRYAMVLNSVLPLGVGRNAGTISFNFPIPKLRTKPTFSTSGTIKMLNSPSTTGLRFTYNTYDDGWVRLLITIACSEGSAYAFAGEGDGYYSFDAEIY